MYEFFVDTPIVDGNRAENGTKILLKNTNQPPNQDEIAIKFNAKTAQSQATDSKAKSGTKRSYGNCRQSSYREYKFRRMAREHLRSPSRQASIRSTNVRRKRELCAKFPSTLTRRP
jgi:hypothetical protein